MPKRLTPVPREQIDSTNNDPAYWDDILRREGLSMTRGLHPNVYIGTSKELDEMTEGAPVSYGNHYGTISQFKDDP